jgi:hypothetical protein
MSCSMDAGYDKPLERLPSSYRWWPEPRQMQLVPNWFFLRWGWAMALPKKYNLNYSDTGFGGYHADFGETGTISSNNSHRSGSGGRWQHDRSDSCWSSRRLLMT